MDSTAPMSAWEQTNAKLKNIPRSCTQVRIWPRIMAPSSTSSVLSRAFCMNTFLRSLSFASFLYPQLPFRFFFQLRLEEPLSAQPARPEEAEEWKCINKERACALFILFFFSLSLFPSLVTLGDTNCWCHSKSQAQRIRKFSSISLLIVQLLLFFLFLVLFSLSLAACCCPRTD